MGRIVKKKRKDKEYAKIHGWGLSTSRINQSIKPTVERLSYIVHDSFLSRDPHLLTISLFECDKVNKIQLQ